MACGMHAIDMGIILDKHAIAPESGRVSGMLENKSGGNRVKMRGQ